MALKGKDQADTTTAVDTNDTEVETNSKVEKFEEKFATESMGQMVERPQVTPPSTQVVKISAFITNPMIVEATADAVYGTFPSVVASGGAHMIGKIDLGKTLKFQAIIAKDVKKIIPGSQDDEAGQFFQVSDDGETVADGRSLDEALADAHEAGFEKAKIKNYIDVIAIITECDDDDWVGETVTLQLSPTSIYTWRPLAGRCKMKAATGKLKAEPVLGDPELGHAVVFTSVATNDEFNNNKFTKFVFSI